MRNEPQTCVLDSLDGMEGRFRTAEQAADYLGGLNSRTVTRWAREGYLPAYPIGEGKRRLWRFLEADLEVWMLARHNGKTSPGRLYSVVLCQQPSVPGHGD